MIYTLRLYIMGDAPNAARALQNIKKIFEEQFQGQYDLQVIDILKEPELAEQDRIFAIPSLLKLLPKPESLLVGDLSNKADVLLGMGLFFKKEEQQ